MLRHPRLVYRWMASPSIARAFVPTLYYHRVVLQSSQIPNTQFLMEWSNDVIMEFLDMYEAEAIIWNPQHDHHRDRNQVHDAWKRIQADLSIECSLKELKKKKETLMATYRKLAVKVKMSTRRMDGTSELYKPVWFAYDKMDSFLRNVYTPRTNKTNEMLENDLHDDELPDIEDETLSNITDPLEHFGIKTEYPDEGSHEIEDESPINKKRKVEKADEGYHHLLKQIAGEPKVTKDETYLFCELLCLRLRSLDPEAREIAMHEINNFMFHFKNSRKQPNKWHQHYYQGPGYFQNYFQQSRDMNQHESPVHRSGESSVPDVSRPSNSGIPQHDPNDN